MLTQLPRKETSKTIKVSTGEESYTPGRNLPYISFWQFDDDGQKKMEFIPYATVLAATTSGTNTTQLNYANLELDLKSKNIDDLHNDVLKVKQVVSEEKGMCENILAKLELLDHKIVDISVLTTANTKLNQRLAAISQVLSRTTQSSRS